MGLDRCKSGRFLSDRTEVFEGRALVVRKEHSANATGGWVIRQGKPSSYALSDNR